MTAAQEPVNVFAGAHFDRLGNHRHDSDWLNRQWHSPRAALLPVWKQHNLLDGDPLAPVLLSPRALPAVRLANTTLLGAYSDRVCFAADLGDQSPPPQLAGEFCSLRSVGSLAGVAAAAVCALAQAMVHWHRRQQHCGQCGSVTEVHEAGYVRRCTRPTCKQSYFPRIDPAIIVLVEHDDHALLGRQPAWPEGIYSTIAGFIEPGESIEDAVRREVREETGIIVGPVTYHSSQPWPFPSSLMVGFHAQALSSDISLEDEELEDADWFSRAQLERRLRQGTLRLPTPLSISYRLLQGWYDRNRPGQLAKLVASIGQD